ncbi:MAG: YidC/Oxa1 family membrane protein insertase [Oscillospiraceae bacterium]|nr:YidC/Oxa1 family membrane protein insertase [Oscillospiraceae bacterium]
MDIWYILMIPFTFILKLFYNIFNSYGVAIILFSLAIKLILFPLSLKGKKSMIQMNMLAGEQQKLQKQFAKDQARYQEELQKLYAREGVSTTGGCLWSLIPLLILFPVYAVVRRPLKYWLGLGQSAIEAITAAVTGTGVTLSAGYPEIDMVAQFAKNPGLLSTAQAAVPEANLYGIDFNFLGIDLSGTPNWKFWEGGITWNSVGLLLIVVLCAVTAFASSQVMMKTNQMNSQNDQVAQQNKMMMWMSPLMMLWFGFIMPGAMGVYIIANSVFSTIQELILGKMLKKDYEAAAEARRLREIEEKEEEKRLRREKAERKAREAEEAKKNKGKKLEAADDKMTPEQREAAREGMRQYARGRAYDPGRYGGVTPYTDPSPKAPSEEPKEPWEDKTKE